MACSLIDGRYLCSTMAEARRLDTARNGGWFGKVTDGAIEIVRGLGDAVTGLVAFPEDTARYVTGTDESYGQRRSWAYFGDSAQFNWSMRNPVFRVMDVANSVVYGGVNLVLCYTPHSLSRELGLDIPYFSPPPATTRDAARDSVFLATILFGPTAVATGKRAMGIPEKAVPVSESAVAQWAREQMALSRLSPEERVVQRLFANPQAGAMRWPFGKVEVKGATEVKAPTVNEAAAWRLECDLYSGKKSPDVAIAELAELARKGNDEAVATLGRLGDQRVDLVDDVVQALHAIAGVNDAAASKINHLARLYPGYSLRWPSARRQ